MVTERAHEREDVDEVGVPNQVPAWARVGRVAGALEVRATAALAASQLATVFRACTAIEALQVYAADGPERGAFFAPSTWTDRATL